MRFLPAPVWLRNQQPRLLRPPQQAVIYGKVMILGSSDILEGVIIDINGNTGTPSGFKRR